MILDLCYVCVATIGDRSFPTRADRKDEANQPPKEFNYLSYEIAKLIQDGTITVVGPDVKLPMIAVTTKDGSRVCGIHVTDRRDKVDRIGGARYLY